MTKFKMMTASILAVAAMASAVPATANASFDKQSKLVSYKGLDLGSSDGQKQLQRRVKNAVRTVCGFYGARSLKEIASARACMTNAQTKADGAVQVAIARYNNNRQLAARDIMVGN